MKFSPQDLLALVLAVALHVLAGLLLWFGAPGFFQSEVKKVEPVKAVFLDTRRAAAAAEQLKQQQEARRRAEELERQRKAAAVRQRQQELARQKAEQEAQRKAEELARKKAAEQAERQRKAEEAAKKKAAEDAERKRKAEQERQRKAEQERKRKAEEAARQKREEDARKQRQKDRERSLQEALAAEEAALAEQSQRQQDASDREIYARQLSEHIERQWVRPAGIDTEFSCRIRIRQLPGGQIQSYELLESCGNDFLDASVENAIRKSDPLPLPSNRRVFERNLELIFQP